MRTPTLVLLVAPMMAMATLLGAGEGLAASKDEEGLRDGCTWLDRALLREPERDDAFGMFMRGLMPKCQALLEGLARGDKSVRPEGLKAVVNEIEELRSVIDAEHGGPPPATGRPTPDEVARKKVADEKAGLDSEAQKKAEAERQAAEEARRLEAEKKAQEAEARRKEEEAKAAAEAERRLAEQRARETDKERKAREAEEKKAEAARKREEEKLRKEEAERLKQEAKARELEEKKAAEALKREEAARLAAEKKAADEARKQAEQQAREQRLAEDEAKRLIEEAEREAVAEQARLAREKAAELVAAELAAGDEEARLERQRLAEENARRQEKERALKETQVDPARTKARSKAGELDGTWEQPASKELDRNIKRTLNIFTKDGKVQGEVVEEVWYPAPTSWVDRSCEGNTTFRMVTSARVSGEAGKNKLVLWRDIPRVLTCTCPSRCTVETRRRGFDLAVGANGRELSDSSGVFVRPGTVIVGSAKQAAGEAMTGVVVAATPRSFEGTWETPSFKRRDETVVRRLELKLVGDTLRGTLVEKSSQGLPLSSWSERFCGGATRWEWVASWEIEANAKGTSLSLKGKGGDNLTCSCPSKCKKPKDKLSMGGTLGASGRSITIDGDLYEKK